MKLLASNPSGQKNVKSEFHVENTISLLQVLNLLIILTPKPTKLFVLGQAFCKKTMFKLRPCLLFNLEMLKEQIEQQDLMNSKSK